MRQLVAGQETVNPAPLAKAVKTLNSRETNVFSHFPFQT